MKRLYMMATFFSFAAAAGPAPAAQGITPTGRWLVEIKQEIRKQLGELDTAKFSRVFYSKQKLPEGGYPVCGKVIATDLKDVRTTYYFYGTFKADNEKSPGTFGDFKISKSDEDRKQVDDFCKAHDIQ